MEQILNNLGGSQREAKLSLTAEELKPHYQEAYKRAAANISLPGFRKGKVPPAVIKQRFGAEIENEALESIADAEFRAFATADNLRVVGNPALTDIEKTLDGVTFTIVFEVMPEFELGEYRNLTVSRPVRPVTEGDVQEEIDRICLRAASFEPAEQTTDTMYVVTVNMHELDKASGMPIVGNEPHEERVFLDDDQVDMHLRNSLADKKVGDTIQYTAETTDEQGEPPSYQVAVTDIQKVVPAEFTNEFAETITGGRFATTEELRADIERQLSDYFERSSRNAVENQIVDQLVNAHEMEVPSSLVHAVVHQLFDDFKKRNEGAPGIDQLTAHDLEDEFKPSAERIVRWELIRNAIIDAEKIEVEDADLTAAAERFGLPEDQLRMLMRSNRQIEDQLLAEKVMNVLIDYAVVTDVNAESQEPVV